MARASLKTVLAVSLLLIAGVSSAAPRPMNANDAAKLAQFEDAVSGLMPELSAYPPRTLGGDELKTARRTLFLTQNGLTELDKTYPNNPEVLTGIGSCLRMAGNLGIGNSHANAEKILKRAAELAPNAPEPHLQLGLLYIDSKQKYAAAAQDHLDTALKLYGDNAPALLFQGLSVAHFYQDHYAQAAEMAQRYVALVPTDTAFQPFFQQILEKIRK